MMKIIRNGTEPPRRVPEYQRADERDFRTYNATAEDVIAMANGAGYTVRFGKQIVGYFGIRSQAIQEAELKNAKAYKIERAGNSNRVILVELTDEIQTPSAAELIADKIRDQIEVGDAPLSPLAKQRVVMMLHNVCHDKAMSQECFEILYPMAKKDQFDRLWSNISEKEEHKNEDAFMQYAESNDLIDLAIALIDKDKTICANICSSKGVTQRQFEELYDCALDNKRIENDQSFLEKVLRHIARGSVERRIDGDIIRMLRTAPYLNTMAVLGNDEGIMDYLTSNGYERRESEEICSEIIYVGKLLSQF